MYEMTYYGVDDAVWPVVNPTFEPSGVWIPEEGIEGLVSSGEDHSVAAVGRAGVVTTGTQVGAMTGTLLSQVRADASRSADEVYQAWRRSWSRRVPGTFVVSGGSRGPLSCRVRLAEWIGPPVADPGNSSDTECQVSVIADDGVWWSEDVAHTGSATVTNDGIAYLCPRIRWSGAGGSVVLPSGATFTLPSVATERTLYLDANESCVVLRADGSVDDGLWEQLSSVPPEGVPEGESASYLLPAGATLLAATAWDSPW